MNVLFVFALTLWFIGLGMYALVRRWEGTCDGLDGFMCDFSRFLVWFFLVGLCLMGGGFFLQALFLLSKRGATKNSIGIGVTRADGVGGGRLANPSPFVPVTSI
jgi:hypothetical protein